MIFAGGQNYLPALFPILFLCMWFCVTSFLGLTCGWYTLMHRYPDHDEPALLTLKHQSGSMGIARVSMRNILRVSVCKSGLRVGIMRIFGPFSRDFFVPWSDIMIERKDRFLWKTAALQFGNPAIGSMRLFAHTADRLARAAGPNWPEPGPFPEETHQQIFSDIFKQWLAATLFASAFFTLAPRLMAPQAEPPPIEMTLFFPAIAFGIFSVIRYVMRLRD